MSSFTENPTPTTEETTKTTKPTTEPAKMITLRTSDDEIFEVEESVAMEFVTVKSFLEDSPSSTEIPLPNASAKPLSQVIEMCKEHIKFRENIKVADENKKTDEEEKKIKFNADFLKKKSNEELVGMIPVANYLEIKDLIDVLNQEVADRIANKSVEYVRNFFGIKNIDFSPEEEAEHCKQHAWAFEGIDED